MTVGMLFVVVATLLLPGCTPAQRASGAQATTSKPNPQSATSATIPDELSLWVGVDRNGRVAQMLTRDFVLVDFRRVDAKTKLGLTEQECELCWECETCCERFPCKRVAGGKIGVPNPPTSNVRVTTAPSEVVAYVGVNSNRRVLQLLTRDFSPVSFRHFDRKIADTLPAMNECEHCWECETCCERFPCRRLEGEKIGMPVATNPDIRLNK